MTKQKLRADVPFVEARQRIHVNPFGSNIIVRMAHEYVEIDIWGANVPLPGAKRTMEANRKNNPWLRVMKEMNEDCVNELDEVLMKSKNKEKQERYRKRQSERNLRLVINKNFNPATAQMLTLTFAEPLTYDESEPLFKKLLQNLQRKYQNMKYVAVIEPHKKEGYHMHAIVNQSLAKTQFDVHAYIKSGIVKSKKASLPYLWPHGWFDLKALSGGGNLGGCLASYLMKRTSCPEFEHKFNWRRSRNIEWYDILRGEDALELINAYRLGWDVQEVYSYSCFDLEHIQSVRHYEFCLESTERSRRLAIASLNVASCA
ncbi:rolling circle replication-associated protein [Anaeroarcus burkinensis]|uniref:rolling circle replication-associated protein n=1 Tax=Anaeroarcus burkinensis TaxID=82376 RepID=UPI000406F33F|nr:hypothetical protein [Anaeroarcus burkinensis]